MPIKNNSNILKKAQKIKIYEAANMEKIQNCLWIKVCISEQASFSYLMNLKRHFMQISVILLVDHSNNNQVWKE